MCMTLSSATPSLLSVCLRSQACHLALHATVLLSGNEPSPTFVVYSFVALLLACSCGYVHSAAHQRNHGMVIPRRPNSEPQSVQP